MFTFDYLVNFQYTILPFLFYIATENESEKEAESSQFHLKSASSSYCLNIHSASCSQVDCHRDQV